MSMKNPSKKFVKKANEMGKSIQENLSKIFSATVFGVGFVAPLMFASIVQAANYGKGESRTGQWLSNAQLAHTYTNDKSNSTGEYSKWAINSSGKNYISTDNCVVFHDVKFKIVAVDGASAGQDAKVTLWSYDTDGTKFASATGANGSGQVAYNTNKYWGVKSGNKANPEQAYARSNLQTAMASLATTVFGDGTNVDSRIVPVQLKYDSSTNEQKADGSGDLEAQYVWAASKTEVEGWTSNTKYANYKRAVCGYNSWSRSARTDNWNAAWAVGSSGNFTGYTVTNNYYLRPALQILNQTSLNYVVQTHGGTLSSGTLSADSGSGDYTVGYVATDDNITFAPSSNGITLDGININFEASATGYTAAGLLTTSGGTTWAEINGSDANIAYMATMNSNGLDFSGVEGENYTLRVFGVKDVGDKADGGSDYSDHGLVTELAGDAITGLSKGTDGKIHIKIGTHDDVVYNSGVVVTLTNGAVADAAGTASNNIVVSDAGVLNLNGTTLNGQLNLTGGTVTLSGDNTVTNGISVSSGKTGALVGGSTANISTLTGAISNGGTLSLSNVSVTGDVNNSGTLNLQNNAIETLSITGNFYAIEGSKVDFDADITGDKQLSDTIAVTGTVGGTIALGNVNIAVSADSSDSKTLTLFTGSVANDFTITGSAVIAISGNIYEFKQDTSEGNRGNLVATKTVCGITLPDVVSNGGTYAEGKYYAGITSYTLTSDVEVTGNLGTLARVDDSTPRVLTINGNNHKLQGNNTYAGITVGSSGGTLADTLIVKNVSEISGFNGKFA